MRLTGACDKLLLGKNHVIDEKDSAEWCANWQPFLNFSNGSMTFKIWVVWFSLSQETGLPSKFIVPFKEKEKPSLRTLCILLT